MDEDRQMIKIERQIDDKDRQIGRENERDTLAVTTNTSFVILCISLSIPNLKELVEDVETGVCHVPHGVLEGPDDGVEDELELLRRNGQEGREAVQIHSLRMDEKVKFVLNASRHNITLINS